MSPGNRILRNEKICPGGASEEWESDLFESRGYWPGSQECGDGGVVVGEDYGGGGGEFVRGGGRGGGVEAVV